MTQNKKVSILIPTYNRHEYVKDAIESALQQRYDNVEIVVSDNCSPDETPVVVRKLAEQYPHRISYYRQEHNLGMVGNWNFCLEHCTGEYFVLLSDDDFLMPDFVKTLVKPLDRDDSVVFSCNLPILLNEMTKDETYPKVTSPRIEHGTSFIKKFFSGQYSIAPCGIIFRTKDVKKMGGFPEKFPFATDAAMFISLSFRGMVALISQPLCYYRVHASSMTNVNEESFKDFVNITKMCKILTYENKLSLQERIEIASTLKKSFHLIASSKLIHMRQMAWSRARIMNFFKTVVRPMVGISFMVLSALLCSIVLPPKQIKSIRKLLRLLKYKKNQV